MTRRTGLLSIPFGVVIEYYYSLIYLYKYIICLRLMTGIMTESESVGYKWGLSELKEGILSLTAMLNRNGHGTLYFGMDEGGKAVGVDIGKDTLKNIASTVFDSTDPPLLPSVEMMQIDGKDVIKVHAEGDDRPYACEGTIYIRVGEEDRKATMGEIRRMFRSSGDLLIQTVAMNQNLTFRGIEGFLRAAGKHVSDSMLDSACDLRNEQGSYNIQAHLLSDQNDLLTSVTIFSGTDRTDFSKRRIFSGHSLVEIADMVIDYVDSLNEVGVKVDSKGRVDIPLFDIDAFKEAWINACVHNSWIQGTPPFVQMFDDRLEICSFGGIPYWLSEEDFYNGVSRPVNESLMKVFLMCNLSEHTGHGVPEIVKVYGRESFDISDGMVRVTMRFSGERSVVRIREIQGRFGDLGFNDHEARIVKAMMDDPDCTIDSIADSTGIKRPTVGRYVGVLQDKGIIRREGSRKTGKWVVVPEVRLR